MMKGKCFKRLIGWLLLVCMIVGLVPANVFASSSGEVSLALPTATTKAAVNVSTINSDINSLATPYNVAFVPSGYKYSTNFADHGYYYIVHKQSSTVGHLLSTSQKYYDQYVPSTNVTISGTSLKNPDPYNAIQILTVSSNNYRGQIKPYKGYTLRWPSLVGESHYSLGRGLPQNFGGRVSADGRWLFIIYAAKGSVTGDTSENPWFTMQYVASEDAFAFTYHGTDQSEVPTDTTRIFQLYRVYTQGIELYKAIKSVQSYVHGNADGRYPDSLYSTFISYLDECIDAYNTNNKAVTDEAGLKATLDAKAEQLLAYADDLSANVTDMDSYIDIPIEILDFRANGMSIEWQDATNEQPNASAWYNLRKAPGSTSYPPLGGGDSVRQYLTEEYLIKGEMLYT